MKFRVSSENKDSRILTSAQLYVASERLGASGDSMLHRWTSILVKFHIERSSTIVHTARQPTSVKPGKRWLQQSAL